MSRTGVTVFSEMFELVDPQEAARRLGKPRRKRLLFPGGPRLAQMASLPVGVRPSPVRVFRDRPVRLLEIGIHDGGSLQMWRRYLGPRATIHALDINPKCAEIDDPDLTIHIGSQADEALLHSIVDAMGGVDVVIDDGSHVWWHQIATFEALYDKISDDGVYICEDTHTSYWPEYRGEGRDVSFLDYTRTLADALHAWYALDEDRPDTAFARQTRGIMIYDSQVVFEKERRPPPRNNFVGVRCVTGVTGNADRRGRH